MRPTNLMVRPPQHQWESPIAYLSRLAAANETNLKDITAAIANDMDVDHQCSYGLKNTHLDSRPLHWLLRDCSKPISSRPYRWVCPRCLREQQPDTFTATRGSHMEYCLFHDCRPIKRCPSCFEALRYATGNFYECICGFDIRSHEPVACTAEISRLYKAIAANVPYGVTPTISDLEKFSLEEILMRLRNTWVYIWTDGNYANEHYIKSPPIGIRWNVLSSRLGVDNFRLERWAFQLGCWMRHSGRDGQHNQLAQPPFWDYLSVLIKHATEHGCNGPTGVECSTAGLLCKTNKTAMKGDLFPKDAGSFLSPCFMGRGSIGERELVDKRPDPFGDEPSETLEEISQSCTYIENAVIQLVALGGMQPIKPAHPRLWKFEKGEVQRVLRSALRDSWISVTSLAQSGFTLSEGVRIDDFFKISNMGELLYLACIRKCLVVVGDLGSIWSLQIFVKNQVKDVNNLWAQIAIHDAVKKSLSHKARQAAILAQCYLGFSVELNEKELHLFIGEEPAAKGRFYPKQSFVNEWPTVGEIPKNLAWHKGALVNADYLHL